MSHEGHALDVDGVSAPRASSPPRLPEVVAQVSLTLEQYAWICALLFTQPEAVVGAQRAAGISDATWRDTHARWQAWLGSDAERWRRFQTLFAEYQRRTR